MVSIDNISTNGYLRIAQGEWSESNQSFRAHTIPPSDDNPDASDQAGAIVELFDFVNIICQGGDIVAFNVWVPNPHATNLSPFPRRAVHLTYNLASEGDFHERHYQPMEELRT